MTKDIILKSTGFLYAPGFVRWIVQAIYPFDKAQALSVLDAWPDLSLEVKEKILAGDYKVVDEDVIVTVAMDSPDNVAQ